MASACTVASLLASIPTQAAEDWTEIASTSRKKVLLQRDSIRSHGDAVEAWTLYRYDELQIDVGKTPLPHLALPLRLRPQGRAREDAPRREP